MDGIRGLSGWRWLYIIEGAITIAIGLIVSFFIADRYEKATYLSERQMYLMHVRHAQLASYFKDEGLSWKETRKALVDPVIYLSGFIQLCFDVCLYGFVSRSNPRLILAQAISQRSWSSSSTSSASTRSHPRVSLPRSTSVSKSPQQNADPQSPPWFTLLELLSPTDTPCAIGSYFLSALCRSLAISFSAQPRTA